MRSIPQESLKRKGFAIENNPENSLFAEQYDRAKEVLKEIIRSNDELAAHTQRVRNGCYSYYSSLSVFEGDEDDRVPDPINTIIPFIGPRGTGKTSVMLSFQRMLQESQFQDAPELKNCRFIGLDYIDAGILKETEDVIALILARMLQFLLRLEGSFSKNAQDQYREKLRRLFKHFDRFFTNLCRLQGTHQLSVQEGFYETGSSLRELKEIASSYETEREFLELTNELRSFLRECGRRDDNRTPYLVIAIDDIDMYRYSNSRSNSNSYTLLEELYEYLSIPGVVLLVAYHEQMLESNCALHVANKFYCHKNADDLLVREQVHQFLKKVLPSWSRIYTPNFANLYGDEEHYTIKTEEQEVSVKKYTLQCLRKKTGVCYDAKGQKRHFFEMRNLRELNGFLQILNSMKDWDQCVDWQQKENNLNRMLEYVYNEFASVNLWGDEAREYEEMIALPIERQIRFFIENALQRRGKLPNGDPYHFDMRGMNEYKRIERFALNSYGSLLEQLYAVTRCGIYSKRMIYCLLSSYSLELSKLVLYYQELLSASSQKDEEGEKKLALLKKTFRSIFGISVAGDWANRMIPEARAIVNNQFNKPTESHEPQEIKMTQKWEATPIGSVRGKIMSTFVVPFHKELLDGFKGRKNSSGKAKQSSSQTPPVPSKKFDSWLGNIEFFGMFFSGVAAHRILLSSSGTEKSPQKDVGKKDTVLILDKTEDNEKSSDTAHFNLFNFVIHSFFWEDYFENIHQMIRNALESYLHNEEEKEALSYALENSSFYAKYKAWAEKGTPLALPIQHMDLIYNIFKRLADPRLNLLPGSVENKEFWTYLDRLYQSMEQALKEQEEYYEEREIRGLSEPFRSCPFVQQVKCIADLFDPIKDQYGQEQQNAQRKFAWMMECIDKLAQISHQLHENENATGIGMDAGERTGVIVVGRKKPPASDNSQLSKTDLPKTDPPKTEH